MEAARDSEDFSPKLRLKVAVRCHVVMAVTCAYGMSRRVRLASPTEVGGLYYHVFSGVQSRTSILRCDFYLRLRATAIMLFNAISAAMADAAVDWPAGIFLVSWGLVIGSFAFTVMTSACP